MLNFPLQSSGDPPDRDKDTDEHRTREREREREKHNLYVHSTVMEGENKLKSAQTIQIFLILSDYTFKYVTENM